MYFRNEDHSHKGVAAHGGEWSASGPCRLTSGDEAPGTHCIRGWVSPKASMNTVEKRDYFTYTGHQPRFLSLPTLLFYALHETGAAKPSRLTEAMVPLSCKRAATCILCQQYEILRYNIHKHISPLYTVCLTYSTNVTSTSSYVQRTLPKLI
jgi:hypothetical protein